MSQNRRMETLDNLYKLLNRLGPIRTLGVCMGILARLSLTDYRLYKEIKKRAEQ